MPLLVVMPGKRNINRKYNTYCTKSCIEKIQDGKLQCRCGEDFSIWDWHWENDPCANLRLSNNNRDVLFHPIYSSGTAAVKGTVPFGQNMHHYWEVKMVSKLYGTDVMVGLASSKLDYDTWKQSFCSMLGIDDNSYGYSYMGMIQHNKLRRRYGSRYDLGSIVGVHLDMCNGTVEYFLNRKPLGIAFRGLKNKDLYPMVSSTAAQSAMRITCSVSQEPTLQLQCLKVIMKHPGLHRRYRNITGLTRIYDKEYFWIKPEDPKDSEAKKLADLEEEVTLSLTKSRKSKKPRRSWIPIPQEHLSDSSSSSSDDDIVPLKLFRLGDSSEEESNCPQPKMEAVGEENSDTTVEQKETEVDNGGPSKQSLTESETDELSKKI